MGTILVTRDIALKKTGKILVLKELAGYMQMCCSGGGKGIYKEKQTRQFQTITDDTKKIKH